MQRYHLYGLALKSALPLPCPTPAGSGPAVTELAEGSASVFARTRRKAGAALDEARWFNHAQMPDGSTYLRWSELFEFLVSPGGRRITYHALNGASGEVLQTYLLGQVLSFALIRQGIEPLHATAVTVNDQAIAFLGDCGYGKSSLGAAFLQAGHRLLTDDVLVVKEHAGTNPRFWAYPGPPRIKLFPEVATRMLGCHVGGAPMNPLTPKLVVRLAADSSVRAPSPLRALYVLRPPSACSSGARVRIRTLSQCRAFLELTANTFNPLPAEPDRLRRHFGLAARLAAGVPVKSLSYRRDFSLMPKVLAAIQADLKR